MKVLIFHEVGTFIYVIGVLTEIFPPFPDTDNTASAVMVSSAEKCEEIVISSPARRLIKHLFSYPPIMPKYLMSKFK